MMIDLPSAERVLRRIEGQHDTAGWLPPGAGGGLCVYAVYERDDVVTAGQFEFTMAGMGAPIKGGRYAAQPMIPPRLFGAAAANGTQEPEALHRYAFNICFGDTARMNTHRLGDAAGEMPLGDATDAFRKILRLPGVLGFAAVYEAFSRSSNAAELRAAITGRRHTSSYPDAVEVRAGVLIDRADRAHTIERKRGGPGAEVEFDTPLRGDVSTSLRMLMDCACDRLPVDQAGYDERYPSLLQMVDRRGRR